MISDNEIDFLEGLDELEGELDGDFDANNVDIEELEREFGLDSLDDIQPVKSKDEIPKETKKEIVKSIVKAEVKEVSEKSDVAKLEDSKATVLKEQEVKIAAAEMEVNNEVKKSTKEKEVTVDKIAAAKIQSTESKTPQAKPPSQIEASKLAQTKKPMQVENGRRAEVNETGKLSQIKVATPRVENNKASLSQVTPPHDNSKKPLSPRPTTTEKPLNDTGRSGLGTFSHDNNPRLHKNKMQSFPAHQKMSHMGPGMYPMNNPVFDMMGMNTHVPQNGMPMQYGMPMMNYQSSPGTRIHVNPKFAGPRPPIGNLHQMYPGGFNGVHNMDEQQLMQRQRELDEQRQHLLLTQQRRREARRQLSNSKPPQEGSSLNRGAEEPNSLSGLKRKNSPEYKERNPDEQLSKRPLTDRVREAILSAEQSVKPPMGLTIKGAAAAAALAANNSPSPQPSTPTLHQRPPPREQDSVSLATAQNVRRLMGHQIARGAKRPAPYPKENPGRQIMSRIQATPQNQTVQQNQPNQAKSQTQSPSSKQEPSIPISFKGKSSTLLISNVQNSVPDTELFEMGKKVPGGIKSITRQGEQVTTKFANDDAAVVFRRMFNK
ncbi:hypothetical protein DFQ28_006510 [Apophysomyces sp. BC1034]|nr:hypothetical protein DFQ30_003738 [Apophysomyces sp. BC1015]KAG0177019.1 hypothetical protein DFQ29_005343 [Apophysomyces sp. BC1021]KAG0187325.1 hypothetical protein DFQ28_006510 [Apophysomyces sp. BC1034]